MQKINLFIILTTLLFCNNKNSTSDAKAIRGIYCNDIPGYKICTDPINNGGAVACAKKFSCIDQTSALMSALAATPSIGAGTASCSQISDDMNNGIGFYDPVSKACQYSALIQCNTGAAPQFQNPDKQCVSFFVTQDDQTCSPIPFRVSLYDSLTRSCSYISTSDAARFGISSSSIASNPLSVAPTSNRVASASQACWVTDGMVSDSSGMPVTAENSGWIDYTCPPLTFNNPGPMIGVDAMYSYQGDPLASARVGVKCVFDTNTNLVYLFKDVSRNIISPLRSLSQYTQTCDALFIEKIGQPVNAQSPIARSSAVPASRQPSAVPASSSFILGDEYIPVCKNRGTDTGNYAAIGICETVLGTSLNPSLRNSPDFKSCVQQCINAK